MSTRYLLIFDCIQREKYLSLGVCVCVYTTVKASINVHFYNVKQEQKNLVCRSLLLIRSLPPLLLGICLVFLFTLYSFFSLSFVRSFFKYSSSSSSFVCMYLRQVSFVRELTINSPMLGHNVFFSIQSIFFLYLCACVYISKGGKSNRQVYKRISFSSFFFFLLFVLFGRERRERDRQMLTLFNLGEREEEEKKPDNE